MSQKRPSKRTSRHEIEFFGETMARRLVQEGIGADLIVGNNVLAHVPALNDFVKGLKILLKSRGRDHPGVSTSDAADG